MINITKQVKEAIAVNALWSISDFYYFIETLENNGIEVSHWKDEEYWAEVIAEYTTICYVWLKYPLIFLNEYHANKVMPFIKEIKYIKVINSKNLNDPEFTIDMDQDLHSRVTTAGLDTKCFSANDFWFHSNI